MVVFMMVRENEAIKGWFRCDRFMQSGRRWFYMTREGTQVGPFNSKNEAESDLYWYALCAQKGRFYENGIKAREVCRARNW